MDSVLTCIFQAFIYPWLISTLHFPIPYAATLGMIIECISFIVMSAAKTQLGSIIASVVLWIGFTFAAPCSVSIISVRSKSLNSYNRLQHLKKFKEQYYHGIISVIKLVLLLVL